MRKPLRIVTFCMFLLVAVSAATHALCESDYVTIAELRESLPERWVGEYFVENGAPNQLEKGDTVSVDVPIVVPEVDAVPVVRITWVPPAEDLDKTLEWYGNTWSYKTANRNFPQDELTFPVLDANHTFDPDLPWQDAPIIAEKSLKKWIPFMQDKELTCYAQHSYGSSQDNGWQRLCFYTTYHGIPHLIVDSFSHELKSERSFFSDENEIFAAVPSTTIVIRIKRPDQFVANLYTAKEVGLDVEDLPLLPFDEILKAFERQVKAGYAYSLDEVRFGYMVFIDPDNKGEEFVLLPVWAAKGRTRADLSLPFDLKTDQEVLDRIGYTSSTVIAVNAQTGQVYDFYNDKRPDRRYVPHIITWDEVK